MFERYYQEELLYLRELGGEFARTHPTAAHMLAAPGSDPDVERLLEGFAFLSARVRQKLDDEIPEVTHGLMSMLCPHYLRPIPAMTILEFQPVLAALRRARAVPRGTEVRSVPVESTPCRFRTTFEAVLNPLSLEDVRVETGAGGSRLQLGFRIWNQVRAEDLDLRRLRLYLHGDPAVTFALHYHLSRQVREAVVRLAPAGTEGPEARGVRCEPAGFADDEAVLEYPPRSFSGYRLLQEYFVFPPKFLFVDLVGVDALARLGATDRFFVEVRFTGALPPGLSPTRDDIRLHCTPVVNLFPHESDPIRVDRTRTEYRLRPAGGDALHYEVFSIDRVSALAPSGGEEREVPDFHSFRPPSDPGGRLVFYSARLRPSPVDGRSDPYLAFVDARGAAAPPATETVTVSLTCTNRRLPEGLRVGDIQVPSDSSPEFVRFANLFPPTPSIPPPLEGDLHWRLLSHLALGYLSLTNIAVLRGILGLYNFQSLRDARAAGANARRIEGIRSVHARPADLVRRDGVVRGTEVTLELQEDHFAGPGDLHLFASVLERFLALHATLNSFTRLTVRGTQRGEVWTWPVRSGNRILI